MLLMWNMTLSHDSYSSLVSGHLHHSHTNCVLYCQITLTVHCILVWKKKGRWCSEPGTDRTFSNVFSINHPYHCLSNSCNRTRILSDRTLNSTLWYVRCFFVPPFVCTFFSQAHTYKGLIGVTNGVDGFQWRRGSNLEELLGSLTWTLSHSFLSLSLTDMIFRDRFSS